MHGSMYGISKLLIAKRLIYVLKKLIKYAPLLAAAAVDARAICFWFAINALESNNLSLKTERLKEGDY